MFSGHSHLWVSLSVCSLPHSHAAAWPRCMLWNGRWCPLVVRYWADLQSVHGFHCYHNIVLNAKCWRVLVLALCLVLFVLVVLGLVSLVLCQEKNTSKMTYFCQVGDRTLTQSISFEIFGTFFDRQWPSRALLCQAV